MFQNHGIEIQRLKAQLDNLQRQIEELSYLRNLEFPPPFHTDMVAGYGMTVTLDEEKLNERIQDVVETQFPPEDSFTLSPDIPIRIVTGTLKNSTYDAYIQSWDGTSWADEERVWAKDLSGSSSLTASSRYIINLIRDENADVFYGVGGPYFCSIAAANTGNALTDTTKWLEVVGSTTPSAWNGGTAYVVGNLVTSGGNAYICKANNTGNIPPNATYWVLVTLASQGAYSSGSTYAVGDYVQESRKLCAFNSVTVTGGTGITSINGDGTVAQVFSVGTTGTDFAIADIGAGLLQWNLPDASRTARGVVNTGAQEFGGEKIFYDPAYFNGYTNSSTVYNDLYFRVGGGYNSIIKFDNPAFSTDSSYVTLQAYMGSAYSAAGAKFVVGGNAGYTSGLTSGPGQSGFLAFATVTIADVSSAWFTGLSYVGGRTYRSNGGSVYRCYVSHISDSTNEPGVGADWTSYWKLLSASSGTVTVSPLMTVCDDSGNYFLGKTGSISGLDFIAGWCVGGSLDLSNANTVGTLTTGTWNATIITVTYGGTGSDLAATGPGVVVQATTGSALTVFQEFDMGALTDSTGGTADNTVSAVSGTGDDATINDNFADLTAKVNAIRTALRNSNLMA